MSVLQAYMPQAMSQAEVEAAVLAAIAAAGAKGAQDMGKVMAALKPELAGRADMGKVSALVKAKLAGSGGAPSGYARRMRLLDGARPISPFCPGRRSCA